MEQKKVNIGSLIDFDADPEPLPSATAPNDPLTGQSVQQQTMRPSLDSSMWASFDFGTQERAPDSPPKANTLESTLSQLSDPATTPVGNMSQLFVVGVNSAVKGGDGGQHLNTQQNHTSSFTAFDTSQSSVPQRTPQHGGAPVSQAIHVIWRFVL